MLQIGSLVDGKYKILSEIGHGGMSVVYMAINEKANKTWAIKEVRKDGIVNFEAVKQGLIVETDMMKKFNHPNLPSIIDVIDTNDTFLIVMDYIEGVSLKQLLDEEGAQSQDNVIEWSKQLCDVLGYLHSRHPAIIYRDMKPANIMLKPNGQPTLIDFGTAREFKERNVEDTTCLGTRGYAAPEQFGGMGQTDARTDIYCLGATMYHLLTGRNPSEPPYEIVPIRQINPNLSSGLENIIIKCTQSNPDDRYQTASELMYDLEHYEEVDDLYRVGQIVKLVVFSIFVFLTVAFFIGGWICLQGSKKTASNVYYDLLDSAERTADYNKRLNLYLECIEVPNKNGEIEAYVGMVKLFKEDEKFTVEEEEYLITQVSNNKEALLEDTVKYSDLCYEIGKLYWYYYDYGGLENNFNTRSVSSIQWFDDVNKYSDVSDNKRKMALAYSSIGVFNRDINSSVIEGTDSGSYAELYGNLNSLVNDIALDTTETDIVRIEILESARSMMQQYATKFKSDGITYEQLIGLYTQIETVVEEFDISVDMINRKVSHIKDLLEDTYNAIEFAYMTK